MKPKLSALFMSVYMLLCAATSAQNIAFMKGNWYGRAYLPGITDQSYLLTLEVDKIKGNRFEGILKTIRPSDTSIHFDTRVLGMLSGKYFDLIRTKVIYVKNPEETKWQVSCATCKPPKWSFTIEDDQVLIRGEVKKCSKDCDWVSEFSKSLLAFDETAKTAIYALAGKDLPNETVAAVAMKQELAPIAQNNPANTQPAEAGERLPLLPGGEIIFVKNSLPPAATENTNTVFANSAPSYSVRKTETDPKRIILPVPGSIVKRNNGSGSYIYKRTTHTMSRGMASYSVSRASLNIPIAKGAPSAGSIVKEPNNVTTLPAKLPATYPGLQSGRGHNEDIP